MHLAELNIGRLRAAPGDPTVAEFVDNIDRINAMGKRMPGFVWMLEGSGGPGATDHAIGGDPLLVPNLTVWEDAESLRNFVFRTVHAQFFKRRAEWFAPLGQPHFVMWWVAPGHRPTLDEAMDRLEELRANGPGDSVFGWADLARLSDPAASRFPTPEETTS